MFNVFFFRCLTFIIFLFNILYFIPNLYFETPILKIFDKNNKIEKLNDFKKIIDFELKISNVEYKSLYIKNDNIVIEFNSIKNQFFCKEFISDFISKDEIIILDLISFIPTFFNFIKAEPMRFGLDLKGGIHFTIEVDINSSIKSNIELLFSDIVNIINNNNLNYLKLDKFDDYIYIIFESRYDLNNFLKKNINSYFDFYFFDKDSINSVYVKLSKNKIKDILNFNLDKSISVLSNRINELGISESIIQKYGLNKIVIEIPGIQDIKKARNILGKTATLNFSLLDLENDITDFLNKKKNIDSKIIYDDNMNPFLVNNEIILSGDSIVNAYNSFDSITGKPVVNIKINDEYLDFFKSITYKNIGHPMAIIYKEIKFSDVKINNNNIKYPVIKEKIVNIANIMSELGQNFQVSGLNIDDARDLSLLLKSGSLPSGLCIIEEQIIGPFIGEENVSKGKISLLFGLLIVSIFMFFCYGFMGFIFFITLLFNLIIIIGAMSFFGFVITLPGIAGIILTLGMAVDSNVLIFERIKEELDENVILNVGIFNGFKNALSSIFDSNLTTLIVGIILFFMGSGVVKGFSITLCIGIITSMYTSIIFNYLVVDFILKHDFFKKMFFNFN